MKIADESPLGGDVPLFPDAVEMMAACPLHEGDDLHGVEAPAAREPHVEAGHEDAAPSVREPGEGTILLVEDDAAVRQFISSVLGDMGYKVLTAEDPVEITQKGLRQVQMNPKAGLTFAVAMRAFLRADPDIIMVGEMRDKETTSTGIEASLTGHLVFATLHTNSAPESIIRLLDMGMDPFNFADALLGILAQRLAKRLCSKCKERAKPVLRVVVVSYRPQRRNTRMKKSGNIFENLARVRTLIIRCIGCCHREIIASSAAKETLNKSPAAWS